MSDELSPEMLEEAAPDLLTLEDEDGKEVAFEVIDAALTVLKDMATFDEARIDDGYLAEIREKDSFTV